MLRTGETWHETQVIPTLTSIIRVNVGIASKSRFRRRDATRSAFASYIDANANGPATRAPTTTAHYP
jgi:hypothetical protein